MSAEVILIGTGEGLREPSGPAGLKGQAVTSLATAGDDVWALTDGTTLRRSSGGGPWEEVAAVEGLSGRCLLVASEGSPVLVGTSRARLLQLLDGRLVPLRGFDDVKGRDGWYTPWGGPPDTRSLARDEGGDLYANVHVGGIVRSTDGVSWEPAGIDVDADVHQVLAHPAERGAVLAATAFGLATSMDAGRTWSFETDGLHATYCRAVAVADETVLVSASRGHRGQEAAVYRRRGTTFERCRAGLPEWFSDNVDTHCLVAAGETVALGTSDGTVFVSTDAGARWQEAASGLPPVRCLELG